LDHVKWFALFFGAFFAVSSSLQYLYVSRTSQWRIYADLAESAASITKAVAYRGGVDPAVYFKAYNEAADYIVVLSDGAILEVEMGPRRPLRAVLPSVRCPILSEVAFTGYATATYHTETIRPENWIIKAKKLTDGFLILGFSELDEIQGPEQKLAANLALFGNSLEEVRRVNPSKLDNSLNMAALSDAGELFDAFGRLPLRTNAMLVGQMSDREREIKANKREYLVAYSQLRDSEARPVGTIIQFKDRTFEQQALRQQLKFNIWVSGVSFVVFLILSGYYSARQEGAKRAIREAFQHYFSPQIMEAILREPDRLKLGGQRREVTILFSDIRSFTALSERLPPQQMTRLLQEYFDAMTDEVFATEGIVDKYVGDAIMAFWGAPIEQPDQADRAVRTAINMVKRLKRLQDKWKAEGLPGPLDAGIGINLGIATVGNLGSTKRFDYTLVGDAVNAASRIEQLNKEYCSHIIISDTTKAQLTITVPTKDLGEVQVRGKERPIRVYEVEVDA
jgi:class 3 adenylate cyclase